MRSFLSIVVAASCALAAPSSARDASSAPQKYWLKTQYIAGDKSKDGLYVQPYHTGAGTNDAVLVASPVSTDAGFLNNTSWQFDLTDYPWGFGMPGDTDYAGWERVSINAGTGSTGFYIDPEDAPGLLWNPGPSSSFEDSTFKNWLVCDWVHGGPQLFYHARFYNFSYPSSCAEVWLMPEAASS